MRCDSEEIECQMWTGITLFMMSLVIRPAKYQLKPKQVEAGICFLRFAHFKKLALLIVISSCSALNGT